MLFLIGLGLAVVGFFAMTFLEKRQPEMCQKPTRYVDGKLVPGELYPCEHDLRDAGRAGSDDPGGTVELPADGTDTAGDGTD